MSLSLPVAVRLCAILACVTFVVTVSDAAERAVTTDASITIPAGALAEALRLLSEQQGIKVFYDMKDVGSVHTRGVKRAKTVQAAIDHLLKGTALSMTTDSKGAFFIVAKASVEARHGRGSGPRRIQASQPNPLPEEEPEQIVVSAFQSKDDPTLGVPRVNGVRDDMLSAGAANTTDIFRVLTQIFGGGPNQDTFIGAEAQSNTGEGVGVNLRGLGARETLVLVNGRRVAPSGADGEFTDVLNFPDTAVKTLEMTPYDETAQYGADAVSGVVNFELRKDFDGTSTNVWGGTGTRGDLKESLVSQTMGKVWSSGNGLVSFEFYRRGDLPAADRSYAVSDLAPFGGGDFDSLQSNPGNLIVGTPYGVQTWAIPKGQNGRNLTASDLIPGALNQGNEYAGAQIIPSQERWSLYATGQQHLDDASDVFVDLLVGHRVANESLGGVGYDLLVPGSNPFYVNPTGSFDPVVVGYNFLRDFGPQTAHVDVDTLNATYGWDFQAGQHWTVHGYESYSRERELRIQSNQVNLNALNMALADPSTVTAFDPFGDGSYTNPVTLNAIRSSYQLGVDSELGVLDVRADGSLPWRDDAAAKLAIGADLRRQFFETRDTSVSFAYSSDMASHRTVASGFGECTLPLVSPRNDIPGVITLDASLGERYEYYSDTQSSVTPKFGLTWSPLSQWKFRGTWARSARPPTLADLDESRNEVALVSLPDRAMAGGLAPTLLLDGGNAAAKEEYAKSWRLGVDFTSAAVSGLSASATYFATTITNQLQSTTATATLLTDPYYSAIVTRNPTAAEVSSVCSHALYTQGTTTSCAVSTVAAIVDLRIRNLATTVTSGVDFRAAYRHDTDLGEVEFVLNGTWILTFAERQIPGEPLTSLLNTQNHPVDLRLRPEAGWKLAGVHAVTAVNFTDRYWDAGSTPMRRVGAWTTVDLELSYEVPAPSEDSWLHGLTLRIDAQNVFNVNPPFLNNQVVDIGYDQENATPYGRVAVLKVSWRW